ncbi:hypothetical protein Tco_1343382 [Tanacetum coccineum]
MSRGASFKLTSCFSCLVSQSVNPPIHNSVAISNSLPAWFFAIDSQETSCHTAMLAPGSVGYRLLHRCHFTLCETRFSILSNLWSSRLTPLYPLRIGVDIHEVLISALPNARSFLLSTVPEYGYLRQFRVIARAASTAVTPRHHRPEVWGTGDRSGGSGVCDWWGSYCTVATIITQSKNCYCPPLVALALQDPIKDPAVTKELDQLRLEALHIL